MYNKCVHYMCKFLLYKNYFSKFRISSYNIYKFYVTKISKYPNLLAFLITSHLPTFCFINTLHWNISPISVRRVGASFGSSLVALRKFLSIWASTRVKARLWQ
jgi:hypothetical protein